MTACSETAEPPPLVFTAVTFNTGTTPGLGHDNAPDDGYTSAHAKISDEWYGDGLAWRPAVEATRTFLAEVSPDVVVFQEIFFSGDCLSVPPEVHAGFVCEGWSLSDPLVVQVVLGAGYQIACHREKRDKCAAVKRSFGAFRNCPLDVCVDGLDGEAVDGCGRGARVAAGVIDLADGGDMTLVSVHGSSGISADDQACRVAQFEQIFEDRGDGTPLASGARNLVMGDLNTDPGRLPGFDTSAAYFDAHVGPGTPFRFATEVGDGVPGTYAGGLLNIDHVVADAFEGTCWAAGITQGHPPVIDAVYFDHRPIVCSMSVRVR